MIRLIATDMDGTLLKSDGKLPDRFYEVFSNLLNKGVCFAVASGRQYHTLLNNFSDVKDQMIFIAENGAVVMKQQKELFSRVLERHMIEAIINDVRNAEKYDIVLCGKRSAYIEAYRPEFNAEVTKYYHMCEKVQDLLSIDDEILKIAVYDYDGSEENSYQEFYPKWGSTMNVIVSGKHWMDFGRQDVDKGVALRFLQDSLGVTADETMVFGDYYNDVSMMEAAYYSYAMENAPEGVKAKARFIAPSNSEEGVMKVINKLF